MTVFERYTCDLDLPIKLDGCKLYTRYSAMYPKQTVPSRYYIVRRDLIVCLEKLSVAVNYA